MFDIGLFIPLGVLASVVAWNLARYKGRNEYRWSVVCLLFFPALLALVLAKGRQPAGDSAAFRERWASLAAYDPDIKAAVERLAALGPAAVDRFRQAYAEVQTKEAIPLIVADLEARWAAGDRFDAVHDQAARLDALRRQGQLSQGEYDDQKRRLAQRGGSRTLWSGWWWKLPLLVAVLWFVWPREGVAGFPTCGAAASRELVRRAIEDADDRAQVHRRLLALDEIREVSFDAARQDRMCAGTAVLNAGERRIVWRLYRRGDGILVNVTGF
ncbi:hypothetical protein [uncultured Methylobacterium sp.]|jgi:hypothetical protein|uniref:hypothetical protein n=1 Tax=uncultured Methylobacterium sp. TaxID=157278 RepID=UPI00263118C1|nr:hypothetical protein [uncultured Methylobacterium sp.]